MTKVTFTATKAIAAIKTIIANVEDTWLANDGGLTWSACDVISIGNETISRIKEDDIEWLWNAGKESYTIDCRTGEEQSILQEAGIYALPFMWAAWRADAKAFPEETPIALLKRRTTEGMKGARFKIPCPPDRDGLEWKQDIKEVISAH